MLGSLRSSVGGSLAGLSPMRAEEAPRAMWPKGKGRWSATLSLQGCPAKAGPEGHGGKISELSLEGPQPAARGGDTPSQGRDHP